MMDVGRGDTPPRCGAPPAFRGKAITLCSCNQNHFLPLHFVFLTFSFKTRMGDIVSHLYCVERDYSGSRCMPGPWDGNILPGNPPLKHGSVSTAKTGP